MTFPSSGGSRSSETAADAALVVRPVLDGAGPDAVQAGLDEAVELARAIGLRVAEARAVRVTRPAPGALLGKGHRADIAALAAELEPAVIIVDHPLTPIQQRNLEREWEAKVIDRTGLILEIFGARARTAEGKIQVDLAALEYQKSRLVRSWTHLERQRGGAGFMGGPGETQIEIDRRLIGERIARLKKDLEQVRRTRALQRRSRERVPFPIVALVGYTNAGKSTLFNALTGAESFAADMLFATLDPTLRKVALPTGQDVILSDTVGFISGLPTHLVAAFRATLEEVLYADVILHVMDMSRSDHIARRADVVTVLEGMGIAYDRDERIVEVWNKIDLLPAEERAARLNKAERTESACAVSAISGEGMQALLARIAAMTGAARRTVRFTLPAADGKALAWLYAHGRVLARDEAGERIELDLDIDRANLERFRERFGYISFKDDILVDEKRIYDDKP